MHNRLRRQARSAKLGDKQHLIDPTNALFGRSSMHDCICHGHGDLLKVSDLITVSINGIARVCRVGLFWMSSWLGAVRDTHWEWPSSSSATLPRKMRKTRTK